MSVTSISTNYLEQFIEGHDLEAKLAAGQDGRGELPRSFFETYSAFANTDGGVVLLGVEELEGGQLRVRLPVETVLRGGESDCRNRRLQSMFRYLGLGEQAGSGIPKIQDAWKAQHWRVPELVDQVEPNEQTVFTLRMVSLLPADVVEALEREYGRAFAQASEIQKLALVTAAVEHSVNHARLRSMTAAHPRDVTVALASLVQRGLLESGGSHKRTFYFLPGERHRAEVTPLGFELPFTGTRRPAVGHDRTEAEAATVQVTAQVTVQVTIQVAAILNAAREPASRGQLQEAAGLSNRAHFLHRYLQPLLAQGWLEMTIPDKPRSSKQRYRTTQAGLKALEDFVK